jgi:hypothetical protein
MKDRVIYMPWFDDNSINKHILHEWNSEPDFEYFTSFARAKKELIAYHKNCIQEHSLLLKEAMSLKETNNTGKKSSVI